MWRQTVLKVQVSLGKGHEFEFMPNSLFSFFKENFTASGETWIGHNIGSVIFS